MFGFKNLATVRWISVTFHSSGYCPSVECSLGFGLNELWLLCVASLIIHLVSSWSRLFTFVDNCHS